MQKILLFVNPRASQAEAPAAKIPGLLRELGCEVIEAAARSPEDYPKLILRHRQEVNVVCVAGGDGSLQCAAPTLAETKHPLGILPLGTANNVARSLGVPLDLRAACEVVARGQVRDMDLARVNGRIFLSVVGMGFSTLVHDEVPDERKRRWGSLSYALQAFHLLRRRPPSFRAQITSDEHSLRVRALQITVCNGRFYGGHVQIHPDATLDDATLDLSVIEADSFLRGFVKALLPYRAGPKEAGLKLLRSTKFRIQTHPAIKIDVEGATDLSTPADFEVTPAAMKVMVPRSAD